jgi:hypothetical protein
MLGKSIYPAKIIRDTKGRFFMRFHLEEAVFFSFLLIEIWDETVKTRSSGAESTLFCRKSTVLIKLTFDRKILGDSYFSMNVFLTFKGS